MKNNLNNIRNFTWTAGNAVWTFLTFMGRLFLKCFSFVLKYPMVHWHIGAYNVLPVAAIGASTKLFADDLGGRWDVPEGEWVPPDMRDFGSNMQITKSGVSTTTLVTPEDVEGLATSPASIGIYHIALLISAVISALIISSNVAQLGTIIGCIGGMFIIYSILHRFFGGTFRKSVKIGMFGIAIAILGMGNELLNYMPFGTTLISAGMGNVAKVSWIQVVLANLAVLAPLVYVLKKLNDHVNQLLKQSKDYSGAIAMKPLLGKEIRERQAIQGMKDANDGAIFIPLGISYGAFPDVISPSVASPGLKIGISTHDTRTHVFGTGATGEGKTATTRLMAFEISKSKKYGMFVVCGKGKLAYDLENALDYVIRPDEPFNVFHGLTFQDIVLNIGSRFGTKDPKAEVWTQGALDFIRTCLVFIDALLNHDLHDYKNATIDDKPLNWNPRGLLDMSELLQAGKYTDDVVETLVNLHPEKMEISGPFQTAIKYITEVYPAIPNETKNSFMTNVNQWLSKFTTSPSMAAWAEATKPPLSLENIFTDKAKIGIGFGEAQGESGALYLHFINRRFKQLSFSLFMDKKTKNEVFYFFDECYAYVNLNSLTPSQQDDDVFLSQCRELGVHCIYLCQSKAQLVGLYPEAVVDGFWGNFKSRIDFGANEPSTVKTLVNRAGKRPRYIRKNMPNESIDYLNTLMRKAISPIYNVNNQFREKMVGQFGMFGVDNGYAHKETILDKTPVITTQVMGNDENAPPVLDERTYTRYSVIRNTAFLTIQRAGLLRMDFAQMFGADANGNLYPVMDIVKEIELIEEKKMITDILGISTLLSEGKTQEAHALALESKEKI